MSETHIGKAMADDSIINNNNSSSNYDDYSEAFKECQEVEVNCEGDGLRGSWSWYTAKILKPTSKKKNKLYVQYHALTAQHDKTKPLKEWVDSVLVRPKPPRELRRSFNISDEVDAFQNNGWWEGAVIEVLENNKFSVYFRCSRELLVFVEPDLRLHREWVYGKWVPPLEDI